MTEAQLNNSVKIDGRFNKPAVLNFQGTLLTNVGKTGIFVELYDTNADRIIYTGNWYSNKASFNAGEAYSRTLQWLLPSALPNSIYEVTVTLKDWINPSLPAFGTLTFTMEIRDMPPPPPTPAI